MIFNIHHIAIRKIIYIKRKINKKKRNVKYNTTVNGYCKWNIDLLLIVRNNKL